MVSLIDASFDITLLFSSKLFVIFSLSSYKNTRISHSIFFFASAEYSSYDYGYVCMGFNAIITTIVLCARCQHSVLPASVRRAHVVFSTTGFTGGGKPRPTTHETAALQRGIQKASLTWPARTQAIDALAHG